MLNQLKKAMDHYEVILEPEKNEKDWWAGAPSVVLTPNGKFFLAARMREPISPRGRRGYENRILESEDGIHFETIKKIHREEADVPVFERPSLVQNPLTKKITLFGCSVLENGWAIWKMEDVDHPEEIDPTTLKPVLEAKSNFKREDPTGVTDLDASHHQYVRIQG